MTATSRRAASGERIERPDIRSSALTSIARKYAGSSTDGGRFRGSEMSTFDVEPRRPKAL